MMLDGMQILTTVAIAPAAAVTNNTPFVSSILDTDTMGSATFSANFGAVGNGTFTASIQSGNQSNLSDAANETNIIGSLTLAPSANETWKLGYIGSNRYIQVTITPVGNSGNIFLSATWIQGHPQRGGSTALMNQLN